jgi:isochorismate hydrolase
VSDRVATFERVFRPEPGRTALLIVDMRRGFVEPEALEVRQAREIVPVIRVVADGVTTLGPEIQRATLDIVSRAFGRVSTIQRGLDLDLVGDRRCATRCDSRE